MAHHEKHPTICRVFFYCFEFYSALNSSGSVAAGKFFNFGYGNAVIVAFDGIFTKEELLKINKKLNRIKKKK